MPIFIILVVVSFSFYIFYKSKYLFSNRPAEKKWISAKSSIALGLFVAFFGINQFFINLSTVSIIVGIVFVILGGYNIWGGIKKYKFYLPHAIDEAEQLKSQH